MNTQLSHAETQTVRSPHRSNPRNIVSALSVCMALQMTSFVMILPLFARRFTEFGAGVEALGLSAMAYALTGTITAPIMGALSDRFGRRLLILGSLVVYVLAFSGYLIASSAEVFILLRGLTGTFTAGLVPAVLGVVADLAPTDRKAQWIGTVNGGASIGWIVGPIFGGMLYDRWGYEVPLIGSISMAFVAFVVAFLTIKDLRGNVTHPHAAAVHMTMKFSLKAFRHSLPKSLSIFGVLLGISFATMFAWAFIEPCFMFYAYDDLRWNSSMLGLVMSTYGIAMMLGEFGLSRLSDQLGRKPMILTGLLFFSAQFMGLAVSRDRILIAATFVIAGLGNALFDPALNAYILDITPTEHHGRILGIKSTAGSLGSILGPALGVLCTDILSAQGIFMIATGAVFLIALMFILTQTKSRLGKLGQVESAVDPKMEYWNNR